VNVKTWERVESARERWNVLRHPFYRRWSAGELTAEELARYAGQYRAVVEAIAEISERAADAAPERMGLRGHAAEERDHVHLWDGFVDACDGDSAAEATPETAGCVAGLTGDGDVVELMARLYALESGQPEISRTKREGLVGRYGFEDGPATAYFRVHEGRDAEHAAEARELIDELASDDDAERIAAAAEAAFRANWRLLDGV
jgi:pyrroloquinoline quinone (PQQ) biosynthesis protein C